MHPMAVGTGAVYAVPMSIAITSHRMGLIAKLRRFFCGDDQINIILNGLKQLETTIMSAISDFAARQNTHNDRIDAAVTAITADIAELNAQIQELQNNPGPISAADQELLNALEARGTAVAEKLDALNALTPERPAPPTA